MTEVTETLQDLASTPCSVLTGVGPRMQEKLAKCRIHTLQDLLLHLPYRYQDRTRISPIASCRDGEHVVVEGVIQSSQVIFGKRRMLQCVLQDVSGKVQLRFFHFSRGQQSALQSGKRLRCFGELRVFNKQSVIVHPEYRAVEEGDVLAEDTLTPIYHATEGLSQRGLQQLTEQALSLLAEGRCLPEILPEQMLQQISLCDLPSAIKILHRPPPDILLDTLEEGEHPAQIRLAFEELLAYQITMLRLREQIRMQPAPALKSDSTLKEQFLTALPFALTDAQARVSQEIERDLNQDKPMLRLVQGDVGSGKTVVAALAALQAISAGYQVALMAPTEILAEQHYKNMSLWFEPLGLTVMSLSGKSTGRDRREILAFLDLGEIDILIGTHALFQKDVEFSQLGLVIIDEQHRFGVHQRLSLCNKGEKHGLAAHQLIMTATPIPRTLAMTAYADLDLSVIDELPPGRSPVKTVVMPSTRRDELIERIELSAKQGRQIYWVCTLIEESETLQARAAEDAADYLRQQLPQLQVALIHGRMKPAQKELIMQQFKQNKIQLLVATTVIEVGVDVPNASLMIIENAERLGLAQLHQLRGRVGRGSAQSFCVLLYQNPLSQHGRDRLQIMRDTNDGFKIAKRDLEIRGPGEVLGTKQTGAARLRVADVMRDQALLPKVKQAAKMLLEQYPECVQNLIDRWVGRSEDYSKV